MTLAETKDHLNWELIGEVADKMKGERGQGAQVRAAKRSKSKKTSTCTTAPVGRELWIESLGLPAVLPPPEERKDVKTAIGAARAKQARGQMSEG